MDVFKPINMYVVFIYVCISSKALVDMMAVCSTAPSAVKLLLKSVIRITRVSRLRDSLASVSG